MHQVSAGGAPGTARARASVRSTLERRELVHDDSRLKVVAPSSPIDVNRAAAASVRDPDPVIFLNTSALCDQGRGAGRRDPRQARHREDFAARRTPPSFAWR